MTRRGLCQGEGRQLGLCKAFKRIVMSVLDYRSLREFSVVFGSVEHSVVFSQGACLSSFSVPPLPFLNQFLLDVLVSCLRNHISAGIRIALCVDKNPG